MEILRIRRSRFETGLKLYGEVLSDSGKVYKFAYFRRPTFRGWLCNCENFLLSQFSKKRNCKHLRFVRSEVGRYGSTVTK